MNKTLVGIAIIFSAISSGCTMFVRTEPVAFEKTKPVPAERVLAFQESRTGYAKVIITRDNGFMGGGCFLGVTANSVLIGRFDTEESATFFMPAGELEMAVVRDPSGKGLCGINYSAPAVEKQTIKPETTNHFRISLRAYRRPQLIPETTN